MVICFIFFFFFSSRRRHTSSLRDWSSDVCSSDLEIGTRAAEGHIGPVNRWFAGTRHIDEVEALCVEQMKRYFRCNYADHRMCASMIGNAVVYTALSQPGDVIMSAAQPVGGHSSNRLDGPAGAMGRKIVD